MTELDRLIEAVERGEAVKWSDFVMHVGIKNARLAGSAQSGSLDAAKSLHEALLPGWRWTRHHDGEIEVWATGVLSRRWGRSDDKDPSRAWLIAILKAYLSQINKT